MVKVTSDELDVWPNFNYCHSQGPLEVRCESARLYVVQNRFVKELEQLDVSAFRSVLYYHNVYDAVNLVLKP